MSGHLPLLALLGALFAAPVAVNEASVDAIDLERGLRSRGVDLDRWSVQVDPGEEADEVSVRITGPDGAVDERDLTLSGENPTDRARGLAAELALVIDMRGDEGGSGTSQGETTPDDTPPTPPPASSRAKRGFLTGSGQLMIARAEKAAFGAVIGGGGFLLDEHLMLRVDAGWHLASDGSLNVHAVRVAAGVGGGALLADRRVWVGGVAQPGFDLVIAQDAETKSVPGFGVALSALGQLRLGQNRRFVLELRTGADLRFRPLALSGRDGSLGWRIPGWSTALGVGFAL